MDRLTLATFGLGIALAWASLFVCALVLRVPFSKGARREATSASPSFRYRTLVFALLGAASMLVLPSLRESSEALQPSWQPAWPEAATVRAAVEWMRPWVASSAWPASPIGRGLAAIAVCWGFLVAVSFARALFVHARLLRMCRRASEASATVCARAAIVARRLGMSMPQLLVSDETDAPFATGFLTPRIVLPRKEMASFSEEQLDFVLHHELVHVERGDLRVAFLVGMARLVFTAHPMQRRFLGEIAWAREAIVDARVAQDKPLQYASFLLELAQRMSMGRDMKGTLPMADSTLSRRIALLLSCTAHAAPTSSRPQRRAVACLAVAGAGLAACVWLAPTSWAAPPAPEASKTPAPSSHACTELGGPK